MKYAKSNEMKGVILAIVAIFAMIAAGCVIAATDGGVDAALVVPQPGDEIKTGATIEELGEYTIVNDMVTVYVNVGTAGNVTLLVKEGITVQVKGTADNVATIITKDAATGSAGSATVGVLKETGLFKYKGGNDKATEPVSAEVSGAVTDMDVVIAGSVIVAEGLTLKAKIITGTLIYAMMYDNGSIVTYWGTAPDSFTMEAVDTTNPTRTVTLMKGSTTIHAKADASIKLDGVDYAATPGTSVTVSYTYDAAGNSVVLQGTANAGATATITKGKVNTKDYSGTIIGILDTSTESTGKIVHATFGFDADAKVIGKYVLSSSAKHTMNILVEDPTKNSLTIADGATLTIGANITTAAAGDFDLDIGVGAVVDVFGAIKGVTGYTDDTKKVEVVPMIVGAGKLQLRNGCDVQGVAMYNDSWIEELPAVEKQTWLSGVVASDREEKNLIVGTQEDKNLTIPEGVTLTITEMIALGKENKLIINGTLVLANGAQLGNAMDSSGMGSIGLGPNGKIVNNGTIAKYVPITFGAENSTDSIDIRAVDGAVFGTKTIDENVRLTISGDINPIKTFIMMDNSTSPIVSEFQSIIKDGTAVVDADLTVPEKVIIASVYLAVIDAAFTLESEANVVSVNLAPKDGTSTFVNDGAFIGSVGTPTGVLISDMDVPSITGYTVYTIAPEKEKDPFKTYIYGELAYTDKVETGVTPGTLSLIGTVYIAALETLTQEDAVLDIDSAGGSGHVIVEGKYVSIGKAFPFMDRIYGAYYTIKKDHIFTGIVDGMRNIATADNQEVTIYGYAGYEAELDSDLVLNDKDEVASGNGVETLVISKGTSLTVSNGATLDEAIILRIDGKLIVEKDGNCVPDKSKYGFKDVKEDGTIIYKGFQLALDEAQPGDTLILDTPGKYVDEMTVKCNFIIDDGGELRVGKTITVLDTGNFQVLNGTLEFGIDKKGDPVDGAKIDVAGSMAVYDVGAMIDFKKCKITSTGEFEYNDGTFTSDVTLIGAIFERDTHLVLTTLAKALADPDADEITISGDYEDTGKFVLGKKKLIITGNVTIGELDITDGEVEVTGTLNTRMTGKSGTSTPTAVVVEAFTGNASDLANSKGEYSMVIADATAGAVEIASGTVDLVTDTITEIFIPRGREYKVASGATLNIPSIVVIKNQGTFNLMGTLNVPEGNDLDIWDDGKVYLDGTTNVKGNMSVDAASATGTINADGTFEAVSLELTGTLNANGSVFVTDVLTVGASAYKTGAGAAVNGKNLTVDNYIVVYSGSTVSTDIAKTYDKTEFYVNGALYLTAYTIRTDVLAIGDIIVDPVVIPGYDMSGMVFEYNWVDVSGKTIAVDTVVGDYTAIYFEGTELFATIKVSFDKKLTVHVDGKPISSSGYEIYDVPAGEHTYGVLVDAGYVIKEGTLKVLFAGTEINDGKFTVTPEMTNSTVDLVVTAEVSVDNGGNTGSDDDLIIILLIILVVMVVILAIVTVFRMMRS